MPKYSLQVEQQGQQYFVICPDGYDPTQCYNWMLNNPLAVFYPSLPSQYVEVDCGGTTGTNTTLPCSITFTSAAQDPSSCRSAYNDAIILASIVGSNTSGYYQYRVLTNTNTVQIDWSAVIADTTIALRVPYGSYRVQVRDAINQTCTNQTNIIAVNASGCPTTLAPTTPPTTAAPTTTATPTCQNISLANAMYMGGDIYNVTLSITGAHPGNIYYQVWNQAKTILYYDSQAPQTVVSEGGIVIQMSSPPQTVSSDGVFTMHVGSAPLNSVISIVIYSVSLNCTKTLTMTHVGYTTTATPTTTVCTRPTSGMITYVVVSGYQVGSNSPISFTSLSDACTTYRNTIVNLTGADTILYSFGQIQGSLSTGKPIYYGVDTVTNNCNKFGAGFYYLLDSSGQDSVGFTIEVDASGNIVNGSTCLQNTTLPITQIPPIDTTGTCDVFVHNNINLYKFSPSTNSFTNLRPIPNFADIALLNNVLYGINFSIESINGNYVLKFVVTMINLTTNSINQKFFPLENTVEKNAMVGLCFDNNNELYGFGSRITKLNTTTGVATDICALPGQCQGDGIYNITNDSFFVTVLYNGSKLVEVSKNGTVLRTISLPKGGAYGLFVYNQLLHITFYDDNSIYVVNTTTNTVSATNLISPPEILGATQNVNCTFAT